MHLPYSFDENLAYLYAKSIRTSALQILINESYDQRKLELFRNSLPLYVFSRIIYDSNFRKGNKEFNDIFSLSSSIEIDTFFKQHLQSSEIQSFNEAKKCIMVAWPNISKIIEVIQPTVFKPEIQNIRSSSDPKKFGLIYFNWEKYPDIIDWVISIVHEISHHYLFINTSYKSSQINKKLWYEKKFSSLAKKDRPLIGIFHALLAEASMLFTLMQYRKLNLYINEKEKKIAIKLFKSVSKNYFHDYKVLHKFKNENFVNSEFIFFDYMLSQLNK